ncbi:MAG: hypothetical protein GXO56_07975 [Chloroflexi bacterium]|nr:hypothetical protein [Chloroflexota bacterium]
MNKKMLFFTLILAFALLLSACGDESKATPQQAPTQAANQPTSVPASAPTVAPTNTPLPEPTAKPLPELEVDSGWYYYTNANEVRDVVVYNGTAYAATPGGMVAWDLESGYYTKYTPFDGMRHISASTIAYCEMPEPRIVVGTAEGIDVFDPETNTWDNGPIVPGDEYINDADVDALYCDNARGLLLIGYDGLGVFDFNTGEYTHYGEDDGLPWSGVSDVLVDGDSFWIASGYNGVFQIKNGQVTVYDEDNGMPNETAYALGMAPDGTLWVGTSGDLLSFKNGVWTEHDTYGNAMDIEIGADGSVWYATDSFGAGHICQFDPAAEDCAYLYDGNGMDALTLDGDTVVFGGEDGLFRYDGSDVREYNIKADQLASNFVDALAVDSEGMLWVGTDNGTQRLNPANPDDSQWELFDAYGDGDNLPGGNWATDIATSPNGGVLIAFTNGDASYYKDGKWMVFEDYYSYDAAAIDAQGNLWLGDDGEGLVVLDEQGNKIMAFTSENGLLSDDVYALLTDGDVIWIGTSAGLMKYADDTLTTIFGEDDVDAPGIVDLALDPDGALVVAAWGGMYRYEDGQLTALVNFDDIDPWLRPLSLGIGPDGILWVGTVDRLLASDDGGETWISYTTEDGLPTNQINTVMEDAYGTLWIGGGDSYTGGGLLRIIPDA